jgi:ABC-type antimicrobial peptide transport system permease subunit
MTNAHALIRINEVGLRKIAGANKDQIIFQFLFESILLCLISLFLAIMFAEAILPFFNRAFDKQLSIGYLNNPIILLYLFFIAVVYGLLAGLAPAIYMGRKNPVNTIKSSTSGGNRSSGIGSFSVILQIALSVLLISGTLIIYKQLRFIRNTPLGINTNYVVKIPINQQIGNMLIVYRNEMMSNPRIYHVTAGQAVPYSEDYKTDGVEWGGKSPDFYPNIRYSITLNDYIETFDMEIVKGRSFSQDYLADVSNFVINESALKYMNLEDPIGEKITFWGLEGEIIGVVKDFHQVSFHREIMPQIMSIHPRNLNALKYIFIKIDDENVPETVAFIEKTTKKFAPDFPVDLSFVDEGIGDLYRTEQQLGKVITLFSILAIFISCLGIFGLAKFNAEQRSKEISIRKINGATIQNIIYLLNINLSKVVLIAFIIATPAAYFLGHLWLENFVYKTNISLWIFLIAGLAAFISTILSIGNVTYHAARKNPVRMLRYE